MKDWLFFPLATLVVTAIVVFALNLGGPRESLTPGTVATSGYAMRGAELIDLTASPGTEIMVGADSAKVIAVQSQSEAPPSAGVFLTLPPAAEAAFAGRTVQATWRVRRERGTGTVRLGYFTLGAGDSGWSDHSVDEAWSDISLRYRPGAVVGDPGFDYAGLWPGGADDDPDGVPLQIESVRVRVID